VLCTCKISALNEKCTIGMLPFGTVLSRKNATTQPVWWHAKRATTQTIFSPRETRAKIAVSSQPESLQKEPT
jgi:hypothetical protein